MVEAGEDQRQGPGTCFPALGMPYLGVKETKIPAETSWAQGAPGVRASRAWSRVAMADLKHKEEEESPEDPEVFGKVQAERGWHPEQEWRHWAALICPHPVSTLPAWLWPGFFLGFELSCPNSCNLA